MVDVPVTLTRRPQAPASWPAPASPRPPPAPASFHVLAKPTGPICNLDCEYCYFLSKEALYPNDRFRMSDDVLEAYVRQMLESQQVPEVTIARQGGEPTLMGVDFFRRAVDLVEHHKQDGQTVHHTLQTNGTLLTDKWCAFFAERGFLVGVVRRFPVFVGPTTTLPPTSLSDSTTSMVRASTLGVLLPQSSSLEGRCRVRATGPYDYGSARPAAVGPRLYRLPGARSGRAR